MFVRRRSAALSGLLALALSVSPKAVFAQSSFEDAIRQFNSETVRGYVQPLADVLVANLSSGYFATAAPRSGLGFSIELIGMGTVISDKLRTYTANTPPGFEPSSFSTPTVFGGKGSEVNHSTIPGLSYRLSDGVLDATMFPTAVPQIRVSGLFDSELVLRYISSDLFGASYPKDDLPKLSMFGIGVRHGLNRWFDDLPVDIAISGSYNSMTFGDFVDLRGTTFGANVGRGFGVLSLMGGIESAGGTMDLTYTSTDPQQQGSVDLDLEAKRQLRFNAGATLDFKVIKLFGTAGFGNVTTYSAGLRLGY